MGGTCAVDLAVMHPDMFGTFEDIAGDIGPNSGNKEQTIARLFGGNADAWAAFDPTTVITRHGPYAGVAGWFDVNGSTGDDSAARQERPGRGRELVVRVGRGERDRLRGGEPAGQARLAVRSHAFAAALPWLAGQIGTPDVPPTPFPAQAGSPTFEQTAATVIIMGYGYDASTVDVRAALESVECVDPLGQHTVGACADMDSTST